ncbi:MAG: FKBP-type peptidyl-prolyl cis-trans isomerase [Muribaculaceae bacterium]|nr:FKBP-type peptidyl-prolyl cis-trans isomerase [Muribaculaceae bacterium]
MAKKLDVKYVAECRRFLEEMAAQPDVRNVSKGVLMRYIEHGKGEVCPRSNNVITVKYRGTLIDGTEFDSNMSDAYPAAFRLKDLIVGWQIVLTQMRAGDKVMAYIPSEFGYGDRREGNIPGGSTLIFEIHLVEVH